MKYRNMLKNQGGTHDVVWFGSAGQIRPKSIIFNYTYRYNTTFTNISNTISNIPETGDYSINFTNAVYPHPVLNLTFSISITTNSSGVNILKMMASEPFGSVKINTTSIPSISFIISNGIEDINIDLTNKLITTTSTMSLHGVIQYFNRYNIDCILPCFAIKAPDYVDEQDGIAKSLIQRLSVIKNELWYNINYGFPLLDKVKNKAVFDAYTIKTINAHQEVKKIKEFNSTVENKVYTVECKIISIFGDEFDLNYQTNV